MTWGGDVSRPGRRPWNGACRSAAPPFVNRATAHDRGWPRILAAEENDPWPGTCSCCATTAPLVPREPAAWLFTVAPTRRSTTCGGRAGSPHAKGRSARPWPHSPPQGSTRDGCRSIGQCRGAAAGRAALEADRLLAQLDRYYLAHAVRGALLEGVGRRAEACIAFARALECGCSVPERRLIERRLARVTGSARPEPAPSGPSRWAAGSTGPPSPKGLVALDRVDGRELRRTQRGVGPEHQPHEQGLGRRYS